MMRLIAVLWNHTALLSVALAAAFVVGPGGAARAVEPIVVGSIEEVDLDKFRAIIDQSDDVGAPVPLTRRDLSLRESIEIALRHNLHLQLARLELDALVPELTATRAKFHPTTGFNGSYSDTKIVDSPANTLRDSQDALAFVRQELPIGGNVELGAGYRRTFDNNATDLGNVDPETNEIGGFRVTLRQPLLKGARSYVSRAKISDAEFDRDIADSRVRAAVLSVTARTKSAYYETILAERLIEVIDKAIDRDNELIRYSRALFDSGRVSQRDVVSAEINLTGDATQRTRRLAALELAQNSLSDVLGLPIDQHVDISDKNIPFRPVEIAIDNWIREAIANRPETREIRIELDRAALAIRIRRNSTLPRFDAFGTLQQDINFESRDWRVGAQFEIPFGNVAARSRLKSAQVEHDRVERLLAQQERAIELEVRQIEINLRENVLRLRYLATGVEQARSKREIARGRFELGLANNFDITDADRDLVSAESNLLRAVVDYASNLAFLEAAVARPI